MISKDPHRYDDMLNMEAPEPIRRMDRAARAAQFAGFRALTGHDELLDETARFTDKKLELDEVEKESLDVKMQAIIEDIHNEPIVRVTYFEKDKTKPGGRYISHTGIIKKIDLSRKEIFFIDGVIVSVKDILKLESDLFEE